MIDIENVFMYHSPKEGQPAKYKEIRDTAKTLAYCIKDIVPVGREQSIAFTKLEECVMIANAGIARS